MARLANALVKLREQVNANWPNRSKVSDGWIGDAAHAAVASDHNPNAQGVVTALDITHHPGYFDAHALADRLISNRHPNLKYIISNGRIAGDWTGWTWRPYNGSNPHNKHIHVSVGRGDDGRSQQPYDDTTSWNINGQSPGTGESYMIIQNAENWFGRCNKTMQQIRGRELGRDEFVKYAVGNEFLRWVEAVSDNPEADRATDWQNWGRIAKERGWPELVPRLESQVAELGKRPTQAQLDELKATTETFRKQADEAKKAEADARARQEEFAKKAHDLEAIQASDKAAGDSFLRRLGQFVSKYFK